MLVSLCVHVCIPTLSEGLPSKNPHLAPYPYGDNDVPSLYLGFHICEMGIIGVTTSLGLCEVNTIKHLRQYFAHSRHSINLSYYWYYYYYYHTEGMLG